MEIRSMLAACFGLVHDDCTCYRCWYMGLYSKWIICLLQVWVHCAGSSCTIIACYGIGTIIPDCDCQPGILYYRNYCSRLGISDMDHFCWVNFHLFLCMSAVHGEFDLRICNTLTVCSQLQYGSSTWIRNLKLVLGLGSSLELGSSTGNLDWNPHICLVKTCSFITAKLVSNY